MAGSNKDKGSKWFNSFLGFNAAMGGHGILLPLYMAALGGTAHDFGLITAAYNAVSIGALVFWGKRSDRSGQRKRFILIGMVFTGIFLFFFSHSTDPWSLDCPKRPFGLFFCCRCSCYHYVDCGASFKG